MTDEPSFDPSLPASRQAIRIYNKELLAALALPEREVWPDVSPAVYRRAVDALQERTELLVQSLLGRSREQREGRLALRLFREFARHLLWVDWAQEPALHAIQPVWRERLAGRPEGRMEYDQLFCTVDSTYRRALRLCQHVDPEGGKVLCLGDDDLCSLALRDVWGGEVHVVDLDDRLLSFLSEQAPSLHCHRLDLDNDPIPSSLVGQFDVVLFDPPWEKYPAWLFLQWAYACLKDAPHARIYLSFCPLYLEFDERRLDRLWRDVAALELTFEAIEPCFNLYSLGCENNPELRQLLDRYHIPLASPLVDTLTQIPYVHSDLYVLRRLFPQRVSPWRRWWRRLWKVS